MPASRRSHLTAETRWTQRGCRRNQMNLTAEIAKTAERQSRNRNRGIREIRGRRDTSPAVFRVFRVFRGSHCREHCSQSANNLDYGSAEISNRSLFSAAIASLRFRWFRVVVAAPSRCVSAFNLRTLLRRKKCPEFGCRVRLRPSPAGFALPTERGESQRDSVSKPRAAPAFALSYGAARRNPGLEDTIPLGLRNDCLWGMASLPLRAGERRPQGIPRPPSLTG